MSNQAEAMARKANRANHGPRVLTKKVREMDNPKDNPEGSKNAKGSYRGESSKTG